MAITIDPGPRQDELVESPPERLSFEAQFKKLGRLAPAETVGRGLDLAADVVERVSKGLSENPLMRAATAVGLGGGAEMGMIREQREAQQAELPPPQGFAQKASEFVGHEAPTLAAMTVGFNAGGAALTRLLTTKNPMAARAALAVGRSLGVGAEQAGEAALEGKSAREIAEQGIAAGAITLGFEGIGVVGALAMGRRFVRPERATGLENPAAMEEFTALQAETNKLRSEVLRETQAISQQLGKAGPNPAIAARGARLAERQRQLAGQEAELTNIKAAPDEFARIRKESDFLKLEQSLNADSQQLGRQIQSLEMREAEAEVRAGQAALFEQAGLVSSKRARGFQEQFERAQLATTKAQSTLAQKQAAASAAGRLAETDVGVEWMMRDIPRGVRGRQFGVVELSPAFDESAQKFALNIFRSPENVGRRNGYTGAVVTNEAINAGMEARRLSGAFSGRVEELFKELGKARTLQGNALGGPIAQSRFGIKGEFAAPVAERYQLEGLKGVEREFGPEVAEVWGKVIKEMDQLMDLAEGVAGGVRMRPIDLERNAVTAYFPQRQDMAQELVTDKAVKGLMTVAASKGRPITEAQARHTLERIRGLRRQGLKKAGSLDFQREVPGATLEKAAAGMPMITDPKRLLLMYGDELGHRVAYGRRFGPNFELRDAILERARLEGASLAELEPALDAMLGKGYFDAAMGKVGKFFTSYQILSKLGLAAIPNLSQQANNLMVGGVNNTVRALAGAFSSSDRKMLTQALGSQQGLLASLQHGAMGNPVRTRSDALLSGFLFSNLFTPAEALNRAFAAEVGAVVARDLVAKGTAGRLKGATLERARRQMATLGLDYDTIIKRGALTAEDLLTAAGREVRFAQFSPDAASLPLYWRHPFGRVVAQFKTFSFSQSKFIRDQVFNEALHGNPKPLAAMLTLYPATGEMVASTLDAIKGRERPNAFNPAAPFTDLERYVETLSYVGTMGLLYNATLASRYDDLASFVVGPTMSDLFGGIQNGTHLILGTADVGARVERAISKSPSFRYGQLLVNGAGLAEEVVSDQLRALLDEDEGKGEPASLGELRVRSQ